MKRFLPFAALLAAVVGVIVVGAMAGNPERLRERCEHLADLERRIDVLNEADRHEAAEDLERRAEDLRREIEEMAADRSEHQRPEREDMPRHRHLREAAHLMHAAAEHLEAGGIPEMSGRLHEAADDVQREADKREDRPEAALGELFKLIERLRDEVAELRHRIDELEERK